MRLVEFFDSPEGEYANNKATSPTTEGKRKITAKNDPCWKGYHMVGTKNKGGKEVPNCVPGSKEIKENFDIKSNDRKPVYLGRYVFDIPLEKQDMAGAAGVKQHRDGKWALSKFDLSGNWFNSNLRRANAMFGKGVWEPKQEVTESTDSIDTVTVDVPLLLRLLEYAKEDAQTDMDLHHVTENLIELSQSINTLTMQDYEDIVRSRND